MTWDLDRRSLLLLGGGALLAGCTSERSTSGTPSGTASSSPSAAPSASASAPPSPSATASTGPTLPEQVVWQPGRGELVPAAKRAAVREVERRATAPRAVLQVLDAQYGGLLEPLASVLVVTRTLRLRGGAVEATGRTYDVRVSERGGRWVVTAVHPSRPGRARRRPSDEERRVLRSATIGLPPAARADVLAGRIEPVVLAAMLRLSERFRLDISVLRSGHPTYVFGTTRLSDHPQGLAFDTWRIDGQPVVDPRTSRDLVARYMRAAAAAGSDNVGGPVLLGAAPQWFSDRTHHDHVHAGFPG